MNFWGGKFVPLLTDQQEKTQFLVNQVNDLKDQAFLYTHFPALNAGRIFFAWVLIGLLLYLVCCDWLDVISSVLM